MKLPVLIDKMVPEKELPTNFIRFYIVGFLLFAIPYTRALFFSITALSILLVVAAIFLHHKRWNMSTIVVFSIIAIGSFFLEVAGVATGTIFGHYNYDESLGVKLFDVPLLIGINWVYLIYASQAIIAKMTNNVLLRIFGGALLMVGYDSIMELAAPPMQMWHFDRFYPPIENFAIWFLASLVFHSLVVALKIDVDNKAARMLFGIQILFFSSIAVFSLFFIR